MDFEKTCMVFAMQEPFYGILLSSMARVPDRTVRTMAVSVSGNVFRLLYDPAFTDSLTADELCTVIRHEMLHVALEHFAVFDAPPSSEKEQELRNIAADMEANCYLDIGKIRRLGPVTADRYGFAGNLGAREYFRLLSAAGGRKDDGGKAAKGGDSPVTGGGHGRIDDHSMWPKGSETDMENVRRQVEDMLVAAAEQTEKACGSVPGEMRKRVEALRNARPRPVADWKRQLRRYAGNGFSELVRKSKKRESRRFPDAAGNRHRRKSRILVAIDTSGSVSMPEYLEFFGQIRLLSRHADFRIVECDSAIRHEYEYRGKPNTELHGGGGTDFSPPVDLFNANRKTYDALVYFTDGYAEIPGNVPKETLWVISSEGDRSCRDRYRRNGASVVFIPGKGK